MTFPEVPTEVSTVLITGTHHWKLLPELIPFHGLAY